MKKNIHIKNITYALFLSGLASHMTTGATPISLAQVPAGSASIEPAPNVIVSVDDSGSMGSEGINALKNALKDTFAASNIPDNRLRLAWQSMNGCSGIPSSSCKDKSNKNLINSLKKLDSTHRTNFLAFADNLGANGGTPSHKMIRNAGDYLMRSRSSFSNEGDWPWAENPGNSTSAGRVLSCRKSFHIFMTDGSWNSGTGNTNTHVDADRNLSAYQALSYKNADGTQNSNKNIDASNLTLPDGTSYAPDNSNNKYLNIYQDSWGGDYTETYSCGTSKNPKYCTRTSDQPINTLSDLSFYYWATDLQPSLKSNDQKQNVKPIIKVSTDEIIKSGNKSVTLTPYWNPKNNPATWRNLTTYTIGFATATNWNTTTSGTTQLLKWDGDTYKGSYNDLVLGNTQWPSPLCRYTNSNNSTSVEPSITGTIPCDGSTAYGAQNEVGNRRTELWHMAINGRGKFIPAITSEDLKNAFKDIVSSIIEDTSQPLTGYASSSSSISTQDAKLYTTTYDANGWKGAISSQIAAADTGILSANTAWGQNINNRLPTTADKLDARTGQIASRLILTSNGSAGISFNYANLSDSQKSSLTTSLASNAQNSDKLALGTAIADFIRGSITNNASTVLNFSFRTRPSIQGDIINSAIWFTGSPSQGYSQAGYSAFAARHRSRTPMLYVGGNDGMLHGFSAVDGEEKIAYIPEGIVPKLSQLASSSYSHQYFVDGSAFTGDILVNTTSTEPADRWRTMLTGTLGAGGKGYFVLDVTQPGSTSTSGYASNFSTTNAGSIVVLDKTASSDADIGHIFSTPVVSEYSPQISTQIVKMNNDRWAVVMGNGINSTNERPVLLIQYLDGQKELLKLTASASGSNSSNNGLSAPRLVDLNGDGTPDIIYAGDFLGNLWKFNVSSNDSRNWNIAFDGSPLFSASYTTNNTTNLQPITTAPLVRINKSTAGLMIAFGTGRNITEGDRTDTSKQSFYSVIDNTRYKICATGLTSCTAGKILIDTDSATPTTVLKSNLVARTFSASATAGTGNSTDQKFWSMGNQSEINYANSKGWYFDLPEVGERIVRNPGFYSAASDVIDILSDIPGSGGSSEGETCEPTSTPAKSWRSLMGIEFGLKPTQQLLDTNGDGFYGAADNETNRTTSSPKEISLGTRGGKINIGNQQTSNTGRLINPVTSLNWRQLQ